MEWLKLLFETNGFPARWHCGVWTPAHGWTHIAADVLIWGAYVAIPVSLAVLVRRRDDVPFTRVFWLFVAFILCCGFTHLIDASIFWHPWYRLSGLMKVVTALVSWATVVALFRVIPAALELPGVLREKERLAAEVQRRVLVEARLEKLARELERSNADLDRFAASASHDLRAPLRGVRQLAEWVREDDAEALSEESRANLDMIVERVAHLDAMVAAMLAVARAGVHAGPSGAVDPREALQRVAESLGLAPEFELQVAPNVPALAGPSALVRQVFTNLVQNAVKHHDRGRGVITVTAGPVTPAGVDTPAMVELRVSDDGPGMSDVARVRAFDLFGKTGPHGEISGFGLPTVRRIVERMGGEVRIPPRSGARGATIVFTWPLAEASK